MCISQWWRALNKAMRYFGALNVSASRNPLSRSNLCRGSAAAICVALSTTSFAQQTVRPLAGTGIDLDGQLIELPKEGVLLPEFPKRENLRRIQSPTGAAGREYYIDERSLLMSHEGIVYYTVVLRTSSGANNILYEGLDCRERVVKSFAYGTARGGFKALRKRRWERFTVEGLYGYRFVLWDRYMCGEIREALPPKKIIENLRSLDREDFSVTPERDPPG